MKILSAMKFCLSVIVAAVLLDVTNSTIKNYQIKQQQAVSSAMLEHAMMLSDHLAQALMNARDANIESCSSTSLKILREIRRHYKYIDDIGVLKEQKIICTAVWGVLREPEVLLQPAYLTPNGYLLYQPEQGNAYTKDNQSMTVMKNIIVINSALTFAGFLEILPDYPVVLSTRNHEREFFSTGQIPPKPLRFPDSFFVINTEICSHTKDFCVRAYNKDGGLITLSWPVLMLITLVGLVCGWMPLSFMEHWMRKRKSLESRFVRALKRGELYMCYQPIVRASDEQIMALEALVRWKDNHFGQVSPEFFVGLAERLGLSRLLSDLVITNSLRDMQSSLKSSPDLQLSLNVGDDEVRDNEYLHRLSDQCHLMDISIRQIKIEITERCHASYDEIASFCKSARQSGFSVSLDDFGTGTANIAWLTELDFDEVKIDKLLMNNIADSDKRKMLTSVVDGLRKTGKRLVFEGVETRAQLDFLHRIVPEFLVQGWYTGKPMSAINVKALLEHKETVI